MHPVKCHNNLTIGSLIKEYVSQHKELFVLYIMFVLLIPLQDVGLPHLFGNLVKTIQSKQKLTKPLGLIIGIIFILQIAYSIEDHIDVKMFPSIQKFTRDKMMGHLFHMQKTQYQELKVGEITTKIIKMPSLMYAYMDQWKNLFIPRAVVFVVAVIYFFYQDVLIGATLLVLILALVTMVYNSISHCSGVAKKRDHVYNQLYEEVDDVLRNALTVLNYNEEESELARIDTFHDEYSRLSMAALNCAIKVRYVFMPVICLYLAFFCYYMYQRVVSDKMEPAVFVSLFFIMIQITNSMWKIIANVKEAVLRWGMIQETLDMFEVCKRHKNDIVISQDVPHLQGITIKDLSYSFEKRELFSNINLHIPLGQKLLVVGQIGSGKSTLLRLLMKYAEPHRGEIFINNIPYSKIQPSEIRRFIGYIPQNPILFNRTIYENIVYGMPHISKQHVRTLISDLGLDDVFSRMPDGIDSIVGKYGSKVSGGQRQIIWLVRTIIQDPDIILMDEPTSSIDEKTKEIVHRLCTILMKQKTVIMVTHDAFLTRYADRIIEMKHGVIVKDQSTSSSSSSSS